MIAAVLCGGKGTRLRSVIGHHQKCAVDVGGRPWIHRILDELHDARIEKAVLLTGFMADEIVVAAESWKETQFVWASEAVRKEHLGAPPMEIVCLHSKPSGPEAAIQLAFAKTRAKELLLVNGDTRILNFDLDRFVRNCATAKRETTTIRGRSLLAPGTRAHAGISYRALGTAETFFELGDDSPFLDIGSPAGLIEARRICSREERYRDVYCRSCDLSSMLHGGAIQADGHLSTGCAAP